MKLPDTNCALRSSTAELWYLISLVVKMAKPEFHPITGHEGTERKQMYSPTLSLTSVLDKGGCKRHALATLYAWEYPVPIVQEYGWAQQLVWTGVKNLAPQRDSIPRPSSL